MQIAEFFFEILVKNWLKILVKQQV